MAYKIIVVLSSLLNSKQRTVIYMPYWLSYAEDICIMNNWVIRILCQVFKNIIKNQEYKSILCISLNFITHLPYEAEITMSILQTRKLEFRDEVYCGESMLTSVANQISDA